MGIVSFIFPDDCFDELVVHHRWLESRCSLLFASRILSIYVIIVAMIVKVPQVWTIYRRQNARGLSFFGNLLEFISLYATVAYGYAMEFPFSSYGESSLISFQSAVICAMILFFNRQRHKLMMFSIGCVLLLVCVVGNLHPTPVINSMTMISIIAGNIGRLIQAWDNFLAKGTGSLSFTSVTLMLTRAIARVITSTIETGDFMFILSYLLSAGTILLLLVQILYYAPAAKHAKAADPLAYRKRV